MSVLSISRYYLISILLLVLHFPVKAQVPDLQFIDSDIGQLRMGISLDGTIVVYDSLYGATYDTHASKVLDVQAFDARWPQMKAVVVRDSLLITAKNDPDPYVYIHTFDNNLLDRIPVEGSPDRYWALADCAYTYIITDREVIRIDSSNGSPRRYADVVDDILDCRLHNDVILWCGHILAITDRNLDNRRALSDDGSWIACALSDRRAFAIDSSQNRLTLKSFDHELISVGELELDLDEVIDMAYLDRMVYVLGKRSGKCVLASYDTDLNFLNLISWADRDYETMEKVNGRLAGLFEKDGAAHCDLNMLAAESDISHRILEPGSWLMRNDVGRFLPNLNSLYFSGRLIGKGSTYNRTASIQYGAVWLMNKDRHGRYEGLKMDWLVRKRVLGQHDRGWERVWRVSKDEISRHQSDFQEDGVINKSLPYAILTWPAIGNPHCIGANKRRLIVDEPLARFHDVNGDGKYNAYDGDYPYIRGDEYVVRFSDAVSNNDGMPFVLSEAIFMYDTEDDELSRSTFTEIGIRALVPQEDDTMTLGLHTVMNVECPWGDKMGSIPEMDTWYTYQGRLNDRVCIDTDTSGGDYPIMSATSLDHPLSSTLYGYRDEGLLCERIGFDMPWKAIGLWQDQQPVYLNSHACEFTNGGTTTFVYSGNPAEEGSWSSCDIERGNHEIHTIGGVKLPPLSEDTFTYNTFLNYESEPVQHPCPDIEAWTPGLEKVICHYRNGWLDFISEESRSVELQLRDSLSLVAPPADHYSWSTGESTSQIRVTLPGEYVVEISGEDGCLLSIVFTVSGSVNAPDLSSSYINMYPNPSSGNIHIDFPADGLHTIEIFAMSGHQIYATEANRTAHLKLAHLQSGLYVVIVTDGSGRRYIKKWIKS